MLQLNTIKFYVLNSVESFSAIVESFLVSIEAFSVPVESFCASLFQLNHLLCFKITIPCIVSF